MSERRSNLLSEDEERELFQAWKLGIDSAGHEVILKHMRLVPPIAWRVAKKFGIAPVRRTSGYGNYYANVQILIAAGNLGLCEALRTFQPDKARFATHAPFWIRKLVIDEARSLISVVDRSWRQPQPTADVEVEEHMFAPANIKGSPVNSGSTYDALRDRLDAIAGKVLNTRENAVITAILDDKKQLEIATMLGLSEGRISQIKSEAIAKLSEAARPIELTDEGHAMAEELKQEQRRIAA